MHTITKHLLPWNLFYICLPPLQATRYIIKFSSLLLMILKYANILLKCVIVPSPAKDEAVAF